MSAFAQGERSPPVVSENFGSSFTTSGTARAEGIIPPDFRLDNVLSLSEQLALTMREQRFEDVKRLKTDMIAQHDLEQQFPLTVKDERFDDCIRFRDALAQAQDGKDQMKMG
jgi:hypothetical protein